jgi:hypothetical protein
MQAQRYKRDMVIIDGVYINDFVDTPKGMFFFIMRRKIILRVELW